LGPLTDFVDGYQGATHACGIRENGEVRCWAHVSSSAANDDGQLGTGTAGGTPPVFRAAIVKKVGGAPFVNGLSAGRRNSFSAADDTSCAVDDQGGVFCWGNVQYALNRSTGSTTAFADQVMLNATDPLTDVIGLSSSGSSFCALRRTSGPNEVWCWGLNSVYELGTGTQTTEPYAKKVAAFTAPIRLISAYQSYCVIEASGLARCVGNNGFGRLGSGSLTHPIINPALVRLEDNAPLENVIEISGGYYRFQFLRADGALFEAGNGVQSFAAPTMISSQPVTDAVSASMVHDVLAARVLRTSGDYYIDQTKVPLNCSTVW
jgi:alpha-tubulin suppressor-like RCC1 family protein